MARSILYILILILLPLALLSGIIFRFSFISVIYAILLLIFPWFGPITERKIRTHFRLFIYITGLLSFSTILAQVIFQSILYANKPYGHTLPKCSKISQTLRYFGLERLDNASTIRIVRLIFPDTIILIISFICIVLIRRHQRNESDSLRTRSSSSTLLNWPRLISFLKQIRLFLQCILIGFAAFIYPSLLNLIYMIFFLLLTFLWSFSIKLHRRNIFLQLLLIYTGLHLLIYYLYQFQFFQNTLQPLSFWSNVTGLTALVITNCTDGELYFSKNLVWSDYVNPCLLFVLYFYETILSQRKQLNINPITMPRRQSINANISEQNTIRDVVRAFQRHSYLYVLSLIIMLAWSITYHSLLTLIYLLWACFLWILPNSPDWCLKMSPFFTIYGGILLLLQYASGFKLSFDEFNFVFSRQTMELIGMHIDDYQPAFTSLLVKSFYMMFFWLTLRQYRKKKLLNDREEMDAHQINPSINLYLQRLNEILKKFFTKYWIFVSCGMLLLVSIQNTVVIYRIIYMIFYLFFILSFQISFPFWRKTASTFHLIVIIYSMLVLIGIYIYQFEFINNWLSDICSKEFLLSIGLDIVESEALALNLLTPSLFLVVSILQLYHFHSDWIKLIRTPSSKDKNLQPPPNPTLQDIHTYATVPNNPDYERILNIEPKTWLESLDKLYIRINRAYKHILIYYIWRFSEIHIDKFILLLMVLISVYKVCAFNVILMVLVTLSLIFHRFQRIINLFTLIITGIYILATMCYQLPIAKIQANETNVFIRNCSDVNSTAFPLPDDSAKWFGLEFTTNLNRFISLEIFLTILLTFDGIIRYRQRYRRLVLSNYFNVDLIENRFPVLFEPFGLKDNDNNEIFLVDNQHVDEGVRDFMRYLINFIFYRFGLEICYITTIMAVAIRLDFIAIFYCIWIIIFFILRRRSIQRLWPFYLIFLTIMFPMQYISIVGAPPFLCFNYPWTEACVYGWPQLKRWLFLPDYINPPSSKQLIADFFQLLFVCQQWRVFRYETTEKDRSYIETGGSNREIIYDETTPEENPTWNFVIKRRHWLDYIKYILFMHGIWIVLSIVYLDGIERISLVRLGYLVACFYFFWRGQSFFKEKVTTILRFWHYLIYYCISVIFIKTCLQVVVCIFLYRSLPCQGSQRTSLFCIFVNLIVPCLKQDFMVPNPCPAQTEVNDPCVQNASSASLFMDGLCLMFLLLQKRIFNSYYWKHIVDELRLQKELSKKGAELLEEIINEQKQKDEKRDEEIKKKIDRSFNRIKDKEESQVDEKDKEKSIDHFEAIRSGDYSMFSAETDQEEDEEEEGKQDQATIAQEKILKIVTANRSELDALNKTQSPPTLTAQEIVPPPTSEQPEILPATTDQNLSVPNLEHSTSVVPKEAPKKSQNSFLIKICLINRAIIDYLIDLFNQNCGDYGKVSRKLNDMKSQTYTSPTSRIYSLLGSFVYYLMSHSEVICYFAMVISHVTSGSLISLPLPLSIFFWAMLSSRPSRIYWITVITYTELMIVIKYIFQFPSLPWNVPNLSDTEPLSVVNIIGINQQKSGAFIADLFLLLSLMVHRSILKQLGLWIKAPSPSDAPTETETHPQVLSEPATTNPEESIQNQTPETESKFSFMKPVLNYYYQLQQESSVHDVYSSMFFCEFINMIIVILFYSEFGERTDGSVVQTIKNNKVPVAFLALLLVQFLNIVIDRALYLRRNVRGKLIFHICQVIAIHIWLFFILPDITHTKFSDNIPVQFWYLFKCIYFGYSSIQIRLGYPKRISGNFLMKRPSYVNQIMFRIYLLIPFLLELRTIMDWIFTDTALGLSSWLQFQDIYATTYLLKCARWTEKKSPTKRGVPRSMIVKYGVGGTLLVFLILLIWFPLLFFSFSSSFYLPNPPKEVYMDVKLDGYLPIYQMTAQDIDVIEFTKDDITGLRTLIANSANGPSAVKDTANGFLRNFDPEDIRCVNFFATSINLWEISQPIRDMVISNLVTNRTVPIRFSYTITRNPPNQDNSVDTAAVVTGEHIVDISESNDNVRKSLIEILNGTIDVQTTINFTIDKLMPRFIHVEPKAKPEEIQAFQTIFPHEYYANITMGLNTMKNIPNSTHVWWQMYESDLHYKFNPSCCNLNENYLTMIVFNDKVSPPNISFLTQYGIIGLYTTFVVVVARLLRSIFETSRTIIFNELPSVKRLWRLLRDIDLVRERKELIIEEQLFAKLLFLYRSPETLISFTKPKSE